MTPRRIDSDTGPFAIVPAWLLDAGLNAQAIQLYGVLALYADRATGECFPSRKTLAERCGVAIRTVDRSTAKLVAVRAIRVEHQRSSRGQPEPNRYTVLRVNPVGGGDKRDTTHSDKRGTTGSDKSDTRGGDKKDTLTRVSKNQSHSNQRSAPQNPSGSSVRAPGAPQGASLQVRFLAATKVNEQVAVVVRLFVQEGIELTPQQKAHLGSLLRRRGHGIAVWKAALLATTAAGDPIEMMEGGARSAETRNGHRRGARVTDADDLAAAKRGW